MKLIVKDVLRIERGMPRASPSVILKNYLADSFLRFFEILSPWVYRDNRYRSIEMNYLSTIRFKGLIPRYFPILSLSTTPDFFWIALSFI